MNRYCTDPFCRKDISSGLFWQLLGAMKRTGKRNTYCSWNKELPVLLISGQDDPVGDAGKGVEVVRKTMTEAGLQHVTMHLFPGARHDLLHEEANGMAVQARNIIQDWILQLITPEQL